MSAVIRLGRGETKLFTITLTDKAGAAIDLTGMTVSFAAKRSFRAADAALITKTSPAGGIIVTAPATSGVIVLTLAGTDTTGLADGYTWEGVYDVGLTSGAGAYRRAARGRLVVEHRVAP